MVAPYNRELGEYLRSLTIETLLDRVEALEAEHTRRKLKPAKLYKLGTYRYELWRRIDNLITQEDASD